MPCVFAFDLAILFFLRFLAESYVFFIKLMFSRKKKTVQDISLLAIPKGHFFS